MVNQCSSKQNKLHLPYPKVYLYLPHQKFVLHILQVFIDSYHIVGVDKDSFINGWFKVEEIFLQKLRCFEHKEQSYSYFDQPLITIKIGEIKSFQIKNIPIFQDLKPQTYRKDKKKFDEIIFSNDFKDKKKFDEIIISNDSKIKEKNISYQLTNNIKNSINNHTNKKK